MSITRSQKMKKKHWSILFFGYNNENIGQKKKVVGNDSKHEKKKNKFWRKKRANK